MAHSVLHPTLYTPATTPAHKQLALVNGDVNAAAWRVVLCTEDSISDDQVPEALKTLRTVLAGMNSHSKVSTFVRVRNPKVMAQVLDLKYAERLTGFVIPKADPSAFPDYADQIKGETFRLMPILESSLITVLVHPDYHHMIDALRIGANDMMGHLGIRRDRRTFTIYDTAVGQTILSIVNEFRGLAGFTITAPVFECFGPEYDDLFRKEVSQHILNGLFGQTIIHPRHIRIVRDMYKVDPADLASAQAILEEGRAVAGLNGRMDEYATHWKWAERTLERYALFGSAQESSTLSALLL
jgi:citrate lyase beta subunit